MTIVMIIIFFFLFFYCSVETTEDRTASAPAFLRSSLYKVLVSTVLFFTLKKKNENALLAGKENYGKEERRIHSETRVFILQRDLKLSLPKQPNQKGKKTKKKNRFRASFCWIRVGQTSSAFIQNRRPKGKAKCSTHPRL